MLPQVVSQLSVHPPSYFAFPRSGYTYVPPVTVFYNFLLLFSLYPGRRSTCQTAFRNGVLFHYLPILVVFCEVIVPITKIVTNNNYNLQLDDVQGLSEYFESKALSSAVSKRRAELADQRAIKTMSLCPRAPTSIVLIVILEIK